MYYVDTVGKMQAVNVPSCIILQDFWQNKEDDTYDHEGDTIIYL